MNTLEQANFVGAEKLEFFKLVGRSDTIELPTSLFIHAPEMKEFQTYDVGSKRIDADVFRGGGNSKMFTELPSSLSIYTPLMKEFRSIHTPLIKIDAEIFR